MRLEKTVVEDINLSDVQIDEEGRRITAEGRYGKTMVVGYDPEYRTLDIDRLRHAYEFTVEDFGKLVVLIDKLLKANGHAGLLEDDTVKEQLDRIEEKVEWLRQH